MYTIATIHEITQNYFVVRRRPRNYGPNKTTSSRRLPPTTSPSTRRLHHPYQKRATPNFLETSHPPYKQTVVQRSTQRAPRHSGLLDRRLANKDTQHSMFNT
ncbi:hypothetical protein Zmor_016017 [Zophobas morio]|uniref:Uncharacterized protein n=1 Tax=Zophobas morio TaxID=2755281 RepID=A0AA38IJ23_9CUCU|nr:hypothetical protein Zmor_016017 [Zophobas morio]